MISPLSAQITLRGVKAEVVRALTARCTPRFRVTVLGDSWVVSSATGKQTVCVSVEDAVLALAGAARFERPPAAAAEIDAALGAGNIATLVPALVKLPPAEVVECLLWLAAEHPSVLRTGGSA